MKTLTLAIVVLFSFSFFVPLAEARDRNDRVVVRIVDGLFDVVNENQRNERARQREQARSNESLKDLKARLQTAEGQVDALAKLVRELSREKSRLERENQRLSEDSLKLKIIADHARNLERENQRLEQENQRLRERLRN